MFHFFWIYLFLSFFRHLGSFYFLFRTVPAEPERGLNLFQAPNRDGTALRVDFPYNFRHTNDHNPSCFMNCEIFLYCWMSTAEKLSLLWQIKLIFRLECTWSIANCYNTWPTNLLQTRRRSSPRRNPTMTTTTAARTTRSATRKTKKTRRRRKTTKCSNSQIWISRQRNTRSGTGKSALRRSPPPPPLLRRWRRRRRVGRTLRPTTASRWSRHSRETSQTFSR